MFAGHYSISFIARGIDRSVPLWVLILAVQFVDILWGVFLLLEIEEMQLVPGITASNPFDMVSIPYTHSLAMNVGWFALVLGIYFLYSRRLRSSLIVAGAVFSHWLLDLIVHRADLPLLGEGYKVGFGLWNLPVIAFVVEVGLLAVGLAVYLRMTNAEGKGAFIWPSALCLTMVIIHSMIFFGPDLNSVTFVAVTAVVVYLGFAAVAFWLEPKTAVDGS